MVNFDEKLNCDCGSNYMLLLIIIIT